MVKLVYFMRKMQMLEAFDFLLPLLALSNEVVCMQLPGCHCKGHLLAWKGLETALYMFMTKNLPSVADDCMPANDRRHQRPELPSEKAHRPTVMTMWQCGDPVDFEPTEHQREKVITHMRVDDHPHSSNTAAAGPLLTLQQPTVHCASFT